MKRKKLWIFYRPYCRHAKGTVEAYNAKEACEIIHTLYGFASNTSVYCVETKENYKDNQSFFDRIELELINAHNRGEIEKL